MTRLDRMIERLVLQRDLLDRACSALNEARETLPGPAIELGLGNGRTYHHLKARLDGRRLIAFDRALKAHPDSHPDPADLVLGDIRETAASFAAREGAVAALVHADLGNGIEADDRRLEAWLPGAVLALTRRGAWIVTSTRTTAEGLELVPYEGQQAARFKYFLYRRT